MGQLPNARTHSMMIFTMGINMRRLNAPLYPALEKILQKMITAKMITIKLKIAEVKKIPVKAPVPTVLVPLLYMMASLFEEY